MAMPNSPKSGALAGTSHPAAPAPGGGPLAADPVAVIGSKPYISALVLAAIVGIPISAIAYGFLALVAGMQHFLFSALPNQVLGSPAPAWWPLHWLVLCGLLTALTVRYLPGNGGHSPAFGFATGGGPPTFVISNVLPVPGPKTPESPPPARSDPPGGNAAAVSSSGT
jgi:hypothetical protein